MQHRQGVPSFTSVKTLVTGVMLCLLALGLAVNTPGQVNTASLSGTVLDHTD